jgi:hypothetical protein
MAMRFGWALGFAWTCVFATLPNARAAESTKDPKQMCLDASERGQNERDEGTYRAARESFMACARPTCPRVVLDSCTQWLRELDESAPTLVLGAKDEHGNDLTDVRALFDGSRFADVLDGKPLVADAGEHVLRFERDGSQPVEQRLVVRAGERARLITVTMVSIPRQDPPPEVEPIPQPEPAPHPESSKPVGLFHSPRFLTAAGLGAGAVIAAALGGAFLGLAQVANADAGDQQALLSKAYPGTPSSSVCSLHAGDPKCAYLRDDIDTHTRDVNIAAGLFIGAGVLAAGAVTTWVLWPSPRATTPNASAWFAPTVGGATAGIVGTF